MARAGKVAAAIALERALRSNDYGALDGELDQVRVLANGTVQLIDVQSGAGDNFNQGVSLDGVEFKAQ